MDEHITTGQAIIVLTITRLALAISTMPTVDLPPYNQDMWFMNLLSIIYTLIIFIPLLFLANRFNNFNLTGYLRIIYGEKLGAIIISLYGLYFLANAVNGMTIAAELVTSALLPQENNMTIIIFMAIVSYFVISRGLISAARGFQLLAPIAIGVTILLVILGIENVDFQLLRPVLSDSSFLDINKGSLLLVLFFSDIFILLMTVPQLLNKKSINKIVISSVALSMVGLAIIVIVSQGAIGIQHARHSNMPFLLYVRLIDAFNLLERIDSVFIVGWLFMTLGRNSAFIYISTRTFRDLFKKKEDERIILTIVAVVSLFISVYIKDMRSVIGIRKHFDLFYSALFIIFVIIIPVITCIVYFFRRKTLEKIEPSQELVDKLE